MEIRNIDDLGRVTISRELRTKLGLKEGDSVELSIEDGRLVVEKKEEKEFFMVSNPEDNFLVYEYTTRTSLIQVYGYGVDEIEAGLFKTGQVDVCFTGRYSMVMLEGSEIKAMKTNIDNIVKAYEKDMGR